MLLSVLTGLGIYIVLLITLMRTESELARKSEMRLYVNQELTPDRKYYPYTTPVIRYSIRDVSMAS